MRNMVTCRLYWTDSAAIKEVTFNGTARRTRVYTADVNNRGLMLYRDYFFWSSTISTTTYINRGDNHRNIHTFRTDVPHSFVVDLEVMDEATQRPTRGVCFKKGGCDHLCVPTAGSRVCRCELGYTLQEDGHTCTTELLKKEHILVGDFVARRLYQVDLGSGKLYGKFPLNDSVSALATNPNNTRIYWSEISRKQIMSSKLDGSDASPLLDTGTDQAEGISVDDSTGNLYYTALNPRTNATDGYIAVVTPDGRTRKTLVTGLHSPRAIELHVEKGLMFWTDFGTVPGVWRANLDGSQKVNVISTEIRLPNGIAIDMQENRLYWSDGYRDVIERCTLFGAAREEVVSDEGAHLMSLLIVRDKLYYIGWNRVGVIEVNKGNGSGRRVLGASPMIGDLQDLILITPKAQPIPTVAGTTAKDVSSCQQDSPPPEKTLLTVAITFGAIFVAIYITSIVIIMKRSSSLSKGRVGFSEQKPLLPTLGAETKC